MTIIGSILTEKLSDTDNELVQKLSDASQLSASVHHAVSVEGKWGVNPFINQDSRVAAQRGTIDEYLFSSGFYGKS